MTNHTIYKPKYEKSWALVIGINNYSIASPLGYARQDAEEFAEALISKFGFPQGQVALLLDENATRERIMASFLQFTTECVLPDDRIAVFFAGHGCTRAGNRGEVGFLVPVDGDPNNLATLLRWDDLTRNAELVAAKHLLFVMDACYGGLAIRRSLPPGSSRFVEDMLQRYSRQVLTAGKANETVADAGGPRPGHSIFTGHLLDALDGNAADSAGVISANAVMAYVYDRVSKDPHSRQSPHFGFFDGDGDFIFSAPNVSEQENSTAQRGSNALVQVPASFAPVIEVPEERSLIEQVKDFLSDPRYRIRLDDLVSSQIRATVQSLQEQEFPLQTATVTPEEFAERIRKYETALSQLRSVSILLSRWGTNDHQSLIENVIARLADGTEPRGGKVIWLGLRWYPIMLLMYSGGIAALSARNYQSLATLLTTKVGRQASGEGPEAAVLSTVDGIIDVERAEMFKRLPGHERQYAPRSEYLFKTLQPSIEDLLFLGNSYEDLFDRFEIFYALTCADFRLRKNRNAWGPPGRFGWKYHTGHSPYRQIYEEAEQYGPTWPPLTAGLFAGSLDRFKEVASAYNEQFLKQLSWF